MAEHTNRLINESSPYLRQHAHNPVDWYAWGEEAFSRARAENKPILLSIGYSACHWCHVMERESFEDEGTAQLMNQHFINIKVDREERPDVDHIYMNAVQALTGRGGWPMTMFLTPDGKPFYGGTYFPPEDRHGLPSFKRLLLGVSQAYHEKPEDIQRTVGQLMNALGRLEQAAPSGQSIDASTVAEAAEKLSRAYDDVHGGIGQAPKFPNEAVLELFLRTYAATQGQRYLDMTLHTLRQMARGGIYDQLGGGFHRYSVDEHWLVPHFEKMLYDNAQLVPLYLAAYQITKDDFFARIARETLDYVLREMRGSAGGFYSTQDADSEGVEGKFFVWDMAEVKRIVGDEVADVVCRYWDITEVGNFEHHNIPHVTLDAEQMGKLFRRGPEDIRNIVESARAKLFAVREQRIKPGLDDKMLTSWNALMISAFAKAAEVLDAPRYRAAAIEGIAFIEAKLARGDRLLSTCKDGVAKLNGYLDDYAFVVTALLDVYELVQERIYLERAEELTQTLLRHFWDESSAGFFFTSDDHEQLIVRSKPAFDGSNPSGNSVACRALLRLFHLTENDNYQRRAEAMLDLYAGAAREQPFGFANLLCAVDFYLQEPHEIVIVAPGGASAAESLLRPLRTTYVANRTLHVIDTTSGVPLPELLQGKGAIDGKATAYVCHRRTCSAPVTSWSDLERLLS
ncbi:MAG TPA: thioredoxin domain-containing protein [Candidatus Acidoferrales bacterium]|nr:thioredoxin domain-containing protein [Candidatus Acidoferrales bacterium]